MQRLVPIANETEIQERLVSALEAERQRLREEAAARESHQYTSLEVVKEKSNGRDTASRGEIRLEFAKERAVNRETSNWKESSGARKSGEAACAVKSGARWFGFALLLLAMLVVPHALVAQNVITTVAGQGAAGVSLGLPTGVAADDAGNFYIADTANCVIWKISNGVSSVFAGTQGNCSPGSGASPTLQYPIDVAWCRVQIDQNPPVAEGVLYFATHGMDALASGGSVSSSVGGSIYMANSSGVITQLPNPPEPAGESPLFPVALACDAEGNLFVNSYFNGLDVVFGGSVDEIQYGGTTQTWIRTFGTAYPGIAVYEFDQPSTDSAGNPIEIHVRNVFALTVGAANVTNGWLGVPLFPQPGGLVQLFPPGGSSTGQTINTGGQLSNPSRLAIDSGGNFYITQAAAASSPTVFVTTVPKGGGIQTTFAGNGQVGYQGQGVNPLQAEFNNAAGMAFDACGSLYIADATNGATRKIYNSATASFAPCTAGTSGIGGAGNIPTTSISLTPSATQVAASQAISFTANVSVNSCLNCVSALQGEVLFSCNPVAPTTNACSAGGADIGTILLDGPSPTASTANLSFSFPGPGSYTVTASYFDPTGFLPSSTSNPLTILVCGSVCPDPGILNVRQSKYPIALTPGKLSTQYNHSGIVAFDAFGFTYFLDSLAGTVTAFDGLGGSTQIVAGLTNPSDIVLGSDGNLYITNTGANTIVKVTGPSTTSPTVSLMTLTPPPSTPPLPPLSLSSPTGIFETSSEVYVSDSGNNRVVAFRTDGTFAQVIFSSATPSAPAIGLLQGIVVNPTTLKIYIANALAPGSSSLGNIIVTSIGGSASTLATPGVTLQSPFGLALDASNGLYFSDTGTHQIYRMDVKGNVLVVAGNGTAVETGEGVSATQTGLANPTWLALDLSNSIWFTDAASVRQVDVTQALVDFTAVGQSQTIYLTSPVSGVQGSVEYAFPASPYVTGAGSADFVVQPGSTTTSTCLNTIGPPSPIISPNTSCTLDVTLNTFSGAGSPTINFLAEIAQSLGPFNPSTALTQVITLNEAPAAGKTTLQISPTTLPNGIVGTSYGPVQIQVTGGSGQLTLAQTGPLPPGVMFISNGALSGMPTQAGAFSFTISASDPNGDNGSQLFSLTIDPAISISPSNPSVGAGLIQQFTAVLVGTTSTSIAWSVQPGGAGGTISTTSGSYTAPATAGTDTVIATSTAFPGATASTTVTVTGPPVCPSGATLSISAPSSSVSINQPLQFTANVTGITNPTVSWSATPGTISSAGLYTAPPTPGVVVQISATVTSCIGLSASTTVFVTSTPPPPTPAALPTFSPVPGSYAGVQSVTLSSTPGATIYYTTDGTPPTTSSSAMVYSGAIPVSANETISAYAGGTGFAASATTVGRYSLYALGAELIPGTLSSFISTTPVASVPTDVVFDASGNFYVLDSGLGTITKFAAGTNTNGTVIVRNGLGNPQFFTVGVDGQTLFVSDYENNRIVTVSPSSGFTVNPLTLTGIPTPTTISQPTGIFADPNGFLYVADSGNQRVLKLTSTGTYVSTVVGAGASPTGPGTLLGVAADNAGNVYVAIAAPSSANSLGVVVIKPSGSIEPLQGNLQHGYGIAVDPGGDVYVTDTKNKQVYVYDGATLTQHVVAGQVLGNGAIATDSGDGGPATVGTFANPLGIALDSNYNLYIADANAQAASGGSIQEVNVSQGLWNFASINYGQTASQSVWFLNPTGIPLTINPLNFGGTNAADFTGSLTTPLAIAPGQVIQDNVSFTPSVFGGESATLTPAEVFSGTTAALSQSFTLNGTALGVSLPPTITSISCCNPYTGQGMPSGFPGETAEAITVYGTNFKDPTRNGALPIFNFGPSITVSQVAVINSTTATMLLSILPSAAIGPVSVTVTTGSASTFQGGTFTLSGGFAIAPSLPTILSITASNPTLLLGGIADGYPGETETVTVTGTNLVDPTGNNELPVFNFGPGVTATPVSVTPTTPSTSTQTATVSLVISPTAPIGSVNVTVTTGSATTFQGGTFTLPGGFGIAAYVPKITSITTSNLNPWLTLAGPGGYPGETETVTVTGTNFVDPTGNKASPVFNFGPGITATLVSSPSGSPSTAPQTAALNLVISPTAPIGSVNVTVTTGSATTFQGGTFTLTGGFAIAAYVPTIISITGNNPSAGLPVASGYQGQTESVTVSGSNFADPTGNNAFPVFNFGTGVTANTVSVSPNTPSTTPQTATVSLVITSTATPQSANVTVTTGSSTTFQGGSYTLNGGFQILASNTPAAPSGQTPPVSPVDSSTGTSPVTLIFYNVPQPGETSLTTSTTGPAPLSGSQLGTPAFYYMLSSTVTFTSVEICINYAGVTFTSLPPQLFHYTNGAWVPLPVVATSAPTTVCGMSPSLSPFALFQPVSAPTTASISAPGATYGTPGSVTVSVSSTGGTVTGNVTLSVDGGTASTMALTSGSDVFNVGDLSAGSHSLSASFAAQGNFAASSATGTLTVTPAPLAITAYNASRAYGTANPAFSATDSGFVNGDTAASLSGTLVCNTAATASSPVGSYPISCSGVSSSNYAITFAPGTLAVTPAALTITANSATRVYGGANPTLTASYAGFVNGDTPSVLTGALNCSTVATSASAVGIYPIVCSGQSAANYSITYLPGQLSVTPATLTITANNLTKNFDAPNPALTWTARGFVNGDTTSVFTTNPTCTTTATTTSPVGSYPITCSGTAAANYTFTYVPGTLIVTCHYVSIGLSPSTVAEGGLITVSWTLRSCASTTQTIALSFTLSGPAQPDSCSPTKTEMFSLPPFALKPNTLDSSSFPFKIPKGICPGTYSSTATTTINGQIVDTSSTSLTITAP
jgi:sugar lactone lactonase YvrE